MKQIGVFLAGVLICAGCRQASSGAECIDQSKIDPNAICYELYKPVCGCDNKTYSNDCVARKNGVTSWEEGECPEK